VSDDNENEGRLYPKGSPGFCYHDPRCRCESDYEARIAALEVALKASKQSELQAFDDAGKEQNARLELLAEVEGLRAKNKRFYVAAKKFLLHMSAEHSCYGLEQSCDFAMEFQQALSDFTALARAKKGA